MDPTTYEIQYRGVLNNEFPSESEFYENWPSDICHLLTGVNEFIPVLPTFIARLG